MADTDSVRAGARGEGDSAGADAQHHCLEHLLGNGLSFTIFGETIPIMSIAPHLIDRWECCMQEAEVKVTVQA